VNLRVPYMAHGAVGAHGRWNTKASGALPYSHRACSCRPDHCVCGRTKTLVMAVLICVPFWLSRINIAVQCPIDHLRIDIGHTINTP